MPNTDYDFKAICYAEKYGIIEYGVKDNKMIYYVTYPTEGTYKHTINLDTMEENIKHLKTVKQVGVYNRG